MPRPVPVPATISVVVPIADDGEWLGLCLAALAAQQVAPHEVIVVDTGASPETALVAEAAGAAVLSRPGAGLAAAAAAGYDAATGELIARLDGGAMPPANWLRQIRASFAADPALAAVTGRGVFAELSPVRRLVASAGYHGVYFLVLGVALGQVPLHAANFAMRRAVWEAVQGQVHRSDPQVHDDLDLTMRLGRGRRVRFESRLAVARPTTANAPLPRLGALATSGLRTGHTMLVNRERLRETRIGRLLLSPGLAVARFARILR